MCVYKQSPPGADSFSAIGNNAHGSSEDGWEEHAADALQVVEKKADTGFRFVFVYVYVCHTGVYIHIQQDVCIFMHVCACVSLTTIQNSSLQVKLAAEPVVDQMVRHKESDIAAIERKVVLDAKMKSI